MISLNTKKGIRSGDRVFDIINQSLLVIILGISLFPLWFLIMASFSNPDAINRGEVIFWFKDFDLIGYKRVFANESIWIGYANTILYAAMGVFFSLFITLPFAYALSRNDFKFSKLFIILMMITWYFQGGLIPTFLIIKALGLYNTRFVIIILGSLSVWNVIITRTFFRHTIPNDLWEASLIDGCNHFQYFFLIVIPVSKAIIVVLTLFCAVAQWNDFFKGLMFLKEETKYPLQLVLRGILIQASTDSGSMDMEDIAGQVERERLVGVIRYCVVIIGALPLLIIYPFFQKYFIQGVMIGSVKG